MGNFKETLGVSEMTAKKNGVWKALLAEYIGNFFLNFLGCASILALKVAPKTYPLVSLTFGFVVYVIINTLGHVSGTHLNPAVTCGMLATGNIRIIKALLYIIAQMLGSLTGSALLKALTPERVHGGGLGHTTVSSDLTDLQAFGIEFFLSLMLVLTVFGVCDKNRPESKSTGALAIGLAVALGHLACIDYTGASMNPARSFGSAVIAGNWDSHWVYWVGPILGGIGAGLLYHHVFSAPPSQITIHERYITVNADEKELKRLDGTKNDLA